MPQVPFVALPPHARLWIFAADRPIPGANANGLLERVDAFVSGWKAHGAPLTAARDWRFDRFLLVAVDERSANVSGCSIDALTHSLKEWQGDLGVTLLDNSLVFYRARGEIRRASRAEFRAFAESGAVSGDTVVFDNTVPTIGALEHWERPAASSWHGRAFPLMRGATR